MLLALRPPSRSEQIALTEFIAKRQLSDEEKAAFEQKGAEKFSVAHLKELVIRSRLHRRTIPQVVSELIKHRKKFDKAFEEKAENKSGFGFDQD